ncbi:MAG: hypothetical protein AMXMBFR84_46390 [Candidatus Hydrogenedentota bacterium]
MHIRAGLTCFLLTSWAAHLAWAQPAVTFEQKTDMRIGGKTWLSTVTTPLDEADREATYKVYTHVYDFDGISPLTKGPGGEYTHHRGMFIGWRNTIVEGVECDTWSMPDASQHHIAWKSILAGDSASQTEEIDWRDKSGKPILTEVRTISAKEVENGIRCFDFQSELASVAGKIELKGDSHHGGMQIRMASEVTSHPETTLYLIPQGAEERENDEVFGAWWVVCSPVINNTRYWIMHMTPPDHPTGQPVYSIRRYARFGSFFEPVLEPGAPQTFRFRILLSANEITAEQAHRLYDQYAGEAR